MNWRKIKFWFLLGLFAYLFFLFLQFPITQLFFWFQPLPEKIQVYGATGTIFAGSAALVQKEEWRLEQFTWSFRPIMLLTGRLEFEVTFHNSDETRGQAQVGYTLRRQSYLNNVRMRLPLNTLTPFLQPLPLPLGGWLAIELDHVMGVTNDIDLAGQAILENVVLDGKPLISLGDFLILLNTKDPNQDSAENKDSVSDKKSDSHKPSSRKKSENNAQNNSAILTRRVYGYITDRGGPIQAQIQLQFDLNGAWRLNGSLVPRPNAPPNILSMLSFLGKSGADGKFLISFNGQLPKTF